MSGRLSVVQATRARLAGLRLTVARPAQLAEFYRQVLGMRDLGGARVGYGGQGARLELRAADDPAPYDPTPGDAYWKIGITLPDLDVAHARLTAAGADASAPRQFRDIGYMCHLTDPEGFQIELLQHVFQDAPKTASGDPALPLGGGAQIGQITLRSRDLPVHVRLWEHDLGMRRLSVQPVEQYGFDLYFWAFTDEVPPSPDLEAVANRPWLWQRPYTTVELQHLRGGGDPVRHRAPGEVGHYEIVVDRGTEGRIVSSG